MTDDTTTTDASTDLVPPREAAAALAVSPDTLKSARLRRLAPDHPLHQLPYVRIGRCVRYRRADLDHFIAANLIRGAA
jgi:hypothetical protein